MVSVSVVTFCKGRCEEAQQSLPALLPSLKADDEIVVVDYDDPADVGGWACDHLEGRATVVRFPHARWFHTNHARNLGCFEARGEVLLVSDIDMMVSAAVLEEARHCQETEFLVQPDGTGSIGCVAVHRHHWLQVQGYEEAFVGYGHDDIYFRATLQALGLRQRTMISRVCRVAREVGCRIHEDDRRALNNMVNIKVGKALRLWHRWICNINRNWGQGGVVIAESEFRKRAHQAGT